MNPSTNTGRRCDAAPSTAPAIIAISSPPNSTKHLEGRGGVAARRGLFDRRALAGHAGIVLTGADADAIRQRRRREAMHQQRRGSGVADSHFAERDDVGAGGNLVDRDLAAARQRIGGLLRRHRRLARRVGGAHADFGGNQVRMRGEIRRHAGIDDANRDVAGGGKGIGAGAAGQIGHHHRHRHGGGILRNAFLGEAMVGGEHQQHGLVAAWRLGMPDHAELHGQILDPPQRSRRLGLAVDAPAHVGGELPDRAAQSAAAARIPSNRATSGSLSLGLT